MYEVKNCIICGKVYQSITSKDICPNCEEKDNLNFSKIRDYLFSHPGANVFEVVSVLNIPISMIKHYLREYRLEIVEKEHSFLSCELCGHAIHSGRLCDECFKVSPHNYKCTYREKPSCPSGNHINFNKYGINKRIAL
jgi:hypothetical protein